MRKLFYISVVIMVLFSYVMEQLKPEKKSDKPIIYWATGYDSARQHQIDVFHKWLEKNAPPEDQYILTPAIGESNSKQKVVMQCVSGIGPDIIDVISFSGYLEYFQKMGVIEDITQRALADGYDLTKTFPAIAPSLMVNGKQYAFPCNVSAWLYYVNKSAFKDLGVAIPGENWGYKEFEQTARAFREAAIKKHGEKDGRYFFMAHKIDDIVMLRNLGIDKMNETLTASAFLRKDAEGRDFSWVLDLKHKWIYKDNILPKPTDIESVEVSAGAHGVQNELFRRNRVGMHWTGRWSLTGYRTFITAPKFSDIEIAVLPPPKNGFANSLGFTRAAVMYVDNSERRKQLVSHFFRFLGSKEYSDTIVRSADALPPIPEFVRTEEFLRPKGKENEWPIHQAYAKSFDNLAISVTHGPFIPTNVLDRLMRGKISAVMMENQRLTADEACAELHEAVQERIQLALKEDERLIPEYEKACERQKKIDALREAGEKIPRGLITNLYYIKYYEAKGMLKEAE